MADDVKHTDAVEQAKFLALKPDQQLLQIWLNGRETNGSVGTAIRDIKTLDITSQVHDKRLGRVERIIIGATAVVLFLMAVGPIVFEIMSRSH